MMNGRSLIFQYYEFVGLLLRVWVLVAVGLLVFWPATTAGKLWDDPTMIFANPLVQSPDGLGQIWFSTTQVDYFPLTSSLYWLEWSCFGADPHGYHAVSLALHMLGALCVWALLAELELPAAWLSALLWAILPTNAMTVAWIAEGKNTLSLPLYALSAWAFFCWRRRGGLWRYLAAFFLFVAAVLAKTSGVLLPLVFLILIWWRHGRLTPTDVLAVLPFAVVSVSLAVVGIWFQGHHAADLDMANSNGPAERLLAAAAAVWFYLGKEFVPLALCPIYPRWTPHGPLDLVPLLALVAAAGLLWWGRHEERWGRGPLAALLCYLCLLLPVLGFVNVYFMRFSLVSDHWQYLASIAPLASLCAVLARQVRAHEVPRPLLAVSAACTIGLLGLLTHAYVGVFHDGERMWRYTLERNPQAWIAHTNLSTELIDQGRYEEAAQECRLALEMQPDERTAWVNLGVAWGHTGHYDQAELLQKSLLRRYGDEAALYNNLGNIYRHTGRFELAEQAYQRACALEPETASYHGNLADLWAEHGLLDKAFKGWGIAAALAPADAANHVNRANTLLAWRRLDEARTELDTALRCQPASKEAWLLMGALDARQARGQQALDDFAGALQIDPRYVAAMTFRAWLQATSPQAEVRHGQAAIETAQAAAVISDHRDERVLLTLAAAQGEVGHYAEAARMAELARDLATSAGHAQVAALAARCLDTLRRSQPVRDDYFTPPGLE
jgi:tetratricopeptide (TPR) repeat protein